MCTAEDLREPEYVGALSVYSDQSETLSPDYSVSSPRPVGSQATLIKIKFNLITVDAA
jgi:hypothetical protein